MALRIVYFYSEIQIWQPLPYPKVITQETFDAVVKENVEEFEMELEEARKDAIKQFVAQVFSLLTKIIIK